MRFTVFTLFVNDQDQALDFYAGRLGFTVSEDSRMGDMRWLLVRPPGITDVDINLKLAATADQRALVGKQGGSAPVFALATNDCRRDYQTLKSRGVTFDGEPQTFPFGTGVTLTDLYGNKIYLNEEPS